MYKILSKRNGQLVSCSAELLPYKLIMHYPFDKMVRPEIGKLMVFETLQNCMDFLCPPIFSSHEYYIFKCNNFFNPVKAISFPSANNTIEIMKSYWEGYYDNHLTDAPKGTFFVDWLTISYRDYVCCVSPFKY